MNRFLEIIRAKWTNSPFGTLERRSLVYEWLLHNIILGFAPVWVPAFAFLIFKVFSWKNAVLDGEMIMFAVTLSAISLGFFNKETQLRLRKQEMLTYLGLMLVMLLGVIVRTALALAKEFKDQLVLDSHFVCWMTVALVVMAILLNFRLFTIELNSSSSRGIREVINQPVTQMTAAANQANNVDGIQL